MKTITNTTEKNELQVKESWAKPEVNLIGINEDTLGNTQGNNSDMGSYTS